MRIVFWGSAEFSCPSLEALIHSHHQVVGVVTQPDKPMGRGLLTSLSPVKKIALEHGLPLEQPPKAASQQHAERIRQLAPEIMVVIAYGQILSQALLDIPPCGGVNVHGSLLPKYRGASPINWAIIEGELKTGVTTIQMDKGMDTGDILLQREMPIFPEDTAATLAERMAQLGAEVLLETLSFFEQGQVRRIKQNEQEATYTRLLKKEDGLIIWTRSAEEICRLIRGTNPWPGAFSYLDGGRIKVLQAHVLDPSLYSGDEYQPGRIREVNRKDGIIVSAGQGSFLGITFLQPESKKAMSGWDYAQGGRGKEIVGHDWCNKS